MIIIVAALLFAAAPTPLEKCRALDRSFDAKGMIAPCTKAANDTGMSPTDRADALRLLGFAQSTLGNDKTAEAVFVQLLLLVPEASLPADASPRFRAAFSRAQTHVLTEGAVTVTFTPPKLDPVMNDIPLEVTLNDPLNRVTSVRVMTTVDGDGGTVELPEAPLVRAPESSTFSVVIPRRTEGSVTTTLTGHILLVSPTGSAVEPDKPIAPFVLRHVITPKVRAAAEPEVEIPWLWIGVGTAVSVVAAAAGASWWCYFDGPCHPVQPADVLVVVEGTP